MNSFVEERVKWLNSERYQGFSALFIAMIITAVALYVNNRYFVGVNILLFSGAILKSKLADQTRSNLYKRLVPLVYLIACLIELWNIVYHHSDPNYTKISFVVWFIGNVFFFISYDIENWHLKKEIRQLRHRLEKLTVLVMITILLTGCFTPRKAHYQLQKIDHKYPAILANYCGVRFPVKEVTVIEYRDSVVTEHVPGPTKYVNCDSIVKLAMNLVDQENNSFTVDPSNVPVDCPDNENTTNYHFRETTNTKKDSAELEGLYTEIGALVMSGIDKSDSINVLKADLKRYRSRANNRGIWLAVIVVGFIAYWALKLYKMRLRLLSTRR